MTETKIRTNAAAFRIKGSRNHGGEATREVRRALELSAQAERAQGLIDSIIGQCQSAQQTIEHEEEKRRAGRAFDPFAARRAYVEIASMVEQLLRMQRPQ